MIKIDHKNNTINFFTEGFNLITKSDLNNWKALFPNGYTLNTNAGIEIHSREVKSGIWKGIKLNKVPYQEMLLLVNESKKPIAVYISTTKTIGIILDEGKDCFGHWYRTDSDGVRDCMELLFLYSKNDVNNCINQLKANIAPSTIKKLNLY